MIEEREKGYESDPTQWPEWFKYEGVIPEHITSIMYLLYCRYAIQKKKGQRDTDYCIYCPIVWEGKLKDKKYTICRTANKAPTFVVYTEATIYSMMHAMYNAEIREGTEVLPIRLRIQ